MSYQTVKEIETGLKLLVDLSEKITSFEKIAGEIKLTHILKLFLADQKVLGFFKADLLLMSLKKLPNVYSSGQVDLKSFYFELFQYCNEVVNQLAGSSSQSTENLIFRLKFRITKEKN